VSARGPGRAKRRYALSRIRLINFHNFVDEIIEVRDGGHLFLLGDNGCGKTTALDAVHLALSGGEGLELNAAARVGGRRGEGRSLAGIVLRQDAERGVINEGGATAYVVLELREHAEAGMGEQRLCLGLGMEATTMDARVVRWGVLRRGPLEELPLLTADGGAPPSPTPRDAFRRALERHETFGQITDYRRAVADRLFGGMVLYEEVCRFWTMAKAYREIVASARDFAGLFTQLLPAPDVEVFGEILRSLKAIDDLADSLGQLDVQRAYVAGIATLVDEIGAHREEIARYRWLACRWQIDAGAQKAANVGEEIRTLGEKARGLEGTVEEAGARLDRAARAVAQLSNADSEKLAASLNAAELDLAERTAAVTRAITDHRAGEDRQERAEGAWSTTAGALGAALHDSADALESRAESVAEVPGDRPFLRAALAARRELAQGAGDRGGPEKLPAVDPKVREEQAEAVRAARGEQELRRDRETAADARLGAAEEAQRLIEESDEYAPELPVLALGSEALGAAGVPAEPVYRLLEPRPSANEFQLAALEALAGADALATFVTAPDALDAARAVLERDAPGARLVVREAEDVALPRWAADLLTNPTTPSARRAHAFLAAALAQPPSLGSVEPPNLVGAVELRGAAYRQSTDSPRFIGAAARRRAQEERLNEARERVATCRAECDDARRHVEAARRRLAAHLSLDESIAGLRGDSIFSAHREERQARQAERFAAEQLADASARLDGARERRGATKELVEGLRARARDAGLRELEERLAKLRAVEADARRRHEAAHSDRAAARADLAHRGEVLAATERELEGLRREGAHLGDLLRRHLDHLVHLGGEPLNDEALADYVLVTQRGKQFQSARGLDDRLREAEIREGQREADLVGDGSRGVRNLAWSPSFGFSWNREDNRVEDRRGQPLPSVLAELDRTLDGQRTVVDERTRELMDKLVMGALARHLQEQVEHVGAMVTRINRLLEDLRFGATRYRFSVKPTAERRPLVELVRRISVLDDESRHAFRAFIEERVDDLRLGADDEVPELLDYRRWFDYRLTMRTTTDQEVELTRELRRLGSGGEQGVPNYLLVLALGKLMFDNAEARVRPLLFDEAFYGIDAGRRDQLLRFATELGLQVFVASPDQDGVTRAVKHATTLFVLKDDKADVHLAPHHYWNLTGVAQPDLFAEEPEETPPDAAACVVGEEG